MTKQSLRMKEVKPLPAPLIHTRIKMNFNDLIAFMKSNMYVSISNKEKEVRRAKWTYLKRSSG